MKFYQLQKPYDCAFCTGKQYRFSLVYDFTTTKPTQAVADYTTLKFSDEFNTDGAPDPSKWSYDLGTGLEVGVMVKHKPIPIVQIM
jgi:hypothetical protein